MKRWNKATVKMVKEKFWLVLQEEEKQKHLMFEGKSLGNIYKMALQKTLFKPGINREGTDLQ